MVAGAGNAHLGPPPPPPPPPPIVASRLGRLANQPPNDPAKPRRTTRDSDDHQHDRGDRRDDCATVIGRVRLRGPLPAARASAPATTSPPTTGCAPRSGSLSLAPRGPRPRRRRRRRRSCRRRRAPGGRGDALRPAPARQRVEHVFFAAALDASSRPASVRDRLGARRTGQLAPRSEEQQLHARGLDAERLGDLGVRVPLGVGQPEQRPSRGRSRPIARCRSVRRTPASARSSPDAAEALRSASGSATRWIRPRRWPSRRGWWRCGTDRRGDALRSPTLPRLRRKR